MLIKCNECGKEVSDKANTCPNCGAPVQNNDNKEKELKDLARKVVYKEIDSKELHNILQDKGYTIQEVSKYFKEYEQEKIDNSNIGGALAVIIGIIIFVIGAYFMMNGTGKILDGNNKVQYNEKDDTYTVELYNSYDY